MLCAVYVTGTPQVQDWPVLQDACDACMRLAAQPRHLTPEADEPDPAPRVGQVWAHKIGEEAMVIRVTHARVCLGGAWFTRDGWPIPGWELVP
jgi:hypothetical protein